VQALIQPTFKIIMGKIDITKSLIKNRLVFKNKIFMILDIISFSSLIAFFGLITTLRFYPNNPWVVFCTIVIPFSALLSFVKWNRAMTLRNIITNKSKIDNKILINKIIQLEGYKTIANNSNIIIAFKRSSFLWFRIGLNIINQNNKIFINTNYWDARITWPSIYKTNKLITTIEKINAST
jgi:hypothetical protein